MPIHPFAQQAARFTNVHGITGRADDGVHDVGGSARELSLWAGKWDNTSLLGQWAGFAPGRIAGKGARCIAGKGANKFESLGKVLHSKTFKFICKFFKTLTTSFSQKQGGCCKKGLHQS